MQRRRAFTIPKSIENEPFSAFLKAELPLKRIWTLVLEA